MTRTFHILSARLMFIALAGSAAGAASVTAGGRASTAMDAVSCPPRGIPGPDAAQMAQSLFEPGSTFKPIPLSDIPQSMDRRAGDHTGLCRYQQQNAMQAKRPEAVFMGDSITDAWDVAGPSMFDGRFVDRGISGQTTGQMLGRFMSDVVALKPQVVPIMAGTNDIAGNMGPPSEQTMRSNIAAMVILARVNGIKVVLGSILPADHFWWAPEWQPARKIVEVNAWLKAYASANRIPFVDYHARMSDRAGALQPSLANDGVRPNRAGYKIRRDMAEIAVSSLVRWKAGRSDGTKMPRGNDGQKH